jgi:hypothetical protein
VVLAAASALLGSGECRWGLHLAPDCAQPASQCGQLGQLGGVDSNPTFPAWYQLACSTPVGPTFVYLATACLFMFQAPGG